jgi:uncharacterized protein
MRLTLLAAAALLALAACTSQGAGNTEAMPAAQFPAHPVSGLKVIPLTVVSGTKRHLFKVEVAASADEQEKGMMFRTAMAPNAGMIFPMNPPRPAAFWMRNTVIPLDIIFIGEDRRILNIAANAVPYDERPLPSRGPAAGVLELIGGRAKELGIQPGDRVEW